MKKHKARLIKKSSNRNKRFYALLAIGAVVLIISGVFWYWQSVNRKVDYTSEPITVYKVNAEKSLSKIKVEVISDLKILRKDGKYGSWPLKTVPLIDDRGNPFIKK